MSKSSNLYFPYNILQLGFWDAKTGKKVYTKYYS